MRPAKYRPGDRVIVHSTLAREDDVVITQCRFTPAGSHLTKASNGDIEVLKEATWRYQFTPSFFGELWVEQKYVFPYHEGCESGILEAFIESLKTQELQSV